MSKKAATVGDIGTDHDGFPPTPIIEGSQDIIIDNKPAARVGDALAPHAKPNHPPHDRAITTGSKTVFFNHKPAALTGSEVGCGGVIIGGSSVIIGDQAPSGGAAAMAMRSAEITPVADQLASEPVSATCSVSTVEIPVEGAYWPPYDFAQGKNLKVIYTAEPSSFAVTSLEEADEFYANLYKEMGGKDTIGKFKSGKDLATGLISATKTAQGLGGLGVQSYIKNINGVDWIIIKNFRRHKQTLMKGNKWLASNPKVVQAMIGITSLKGAKTYVKGNPGVEVAFSIGINAADYILRDEATLVEFGVNSAGDMAKGFAATVVAGGLAVALSGGSILAAGAIFAFASWGMGKIFDMAEEEFGVSKKITKEFERLAQ